VAGNHNNVVFSLVEAEQRQSHDTRASLYDKLGSLLGRPVVGYFTSFRYPVMIDDVDAGMLEGVLQDLDLTNGLALMINSPGGSGLAAERIINLCRNYSGTGDYYAIVTGKAKSAATMICMGASKIIMGKSAELGPIDPQWSPPGSDMVFSLGNVIESYDELFDAAVHATPDMRLEPYMQQLTHYDPREIRHFRSIVNLSEDIAVCALKSGMLSGKQDRVIRKKIKPFLIPDEKLAHARPIYSTEAISADLNVEVLDPQDESWQVAYELGVRCENFVNTFAAKCIESHKGSFVVAPGMD